MKWLSNCKLEKPLSIGYACYDSNDGVLEVLDNENFSPHFAEVVDIIPMCYKPDDVIVADTTTATATATIPEIQETLCNVETHINAAMGDLDRLKRAMSYVTEMDTDPNDTVN